MSEFKIIGPHSLQLDLNNNEYFDLIDIENQTYYESSIYDITNAGYDGATVNSISTNPRSLVFTLVVKKDKDVEDAKRYLFRIIKPKLHHKVVWNRNDRVVQIDGVLEQAAMPRWNNNVTVQLTFFCENCYWEDIDDVIQQITSVFAMHYFTTSINDMLVFDNDGAGIVMGEYDLSRTRTYENNGDVAVGLVITIHALSTLTNPVIYAADDTFIGVNITMQAGDSITINTERGQKDITQDGVSIINKIMVGSKWLQLNTGYNTFTIDSDDDAVDNCYFQLSYKHKYV